MNKYKITGTLVSVGLLLGCTMPKQDFGLFPPGYVALEVGGSALLNPTSGLEVDQVSLRHIDTVRKELKESIGDKIWIETNSDGQALLAFSLNTPAGPSDRNGVWISRDWQDQTQATHIKNAVWGKFCSRRFVWIGLQDESYLLDLQQPDHQYPVDPQLSDLQLASNGKWMGSDQEGRLFIGTLDLGVSIIHAHPVSVKRAVKSARLLPGGNYVALVDQDEVCIIDPKSGKRLGCVPGTLADIEFETDSMVIKSSKGYLNIFDVRDDAFIVKRENEPLNSIPLLLLLVQRDFVESARPTLSRMRNLGDHGRQTNKQPMPMVSYTMLLRLRDGG